MPDVVPREGELAGRLVETALPVDVLPTEVVGLLLAVTLFSLVPGAVLATVLLWTIDEDAAWPVCETLLAAVVLPVELPPLVVAVLSAATVSFLLTVLLLPMPPLRLVPLVNTRSAPVVPLVPYHLSL